MEKTDKMNNKAYNTKGKEKAQAKDIPGLEVHKTKGTMIRPAPQPQDPLEK